MYKVKVSAAAVSRLGFEQISLMALVTTYIYPLSIKQTVYDVVIVAVVAACTKFQLIIVVGTLMWEELGEIALRLAYATWTGG